MTLPSLPECHAMGFASKTELGVEITKRLASLAGSLELWDKDMKECKQKILPSFNKMVIFSTTDFSNHGHPDPLTCPDNISRKSLALYYFSSGCLASC